MSARDDFPPMMMSDCCIWRYNEMADEIDRLRDESATLLVMVTRLTEEKEQDAATIAVLDSALRHLNAWCPSAAPRQAEINRLLTRAPLPMRSLLQLRARLRSDEDHRDAHLMYLEQQRWQGMAEDLWEELQEWHAPDCPTELYGRDECACHRLLAARWDELTHADDWADDGFDDATEPPAPLPAFEGEQ